MNVWSICTSISVTITYIWSKFGTEHKHHSIYTPEWPNLRKLKIQDGSSRHLEFRKNVSIPGLDIDILHKIIWGDASRTRGYDHMTKSRNRKLIRVTSSTERLEHKCVLISVTITYIWTKFDIELKHHTVNMTECSKFTWLENLTWWRPPSWILKNFNNYEWDGAICTKFGGQMHYDHAMTHDQNSKVELFCVTSL